MSFLLPSTVYQPPSQQSRGRQLNTIAEHHDEMNYGITSESEGTASDDTVVGKPVYFLDTKRYSQSSRHNRQRPINTYTRGPPSVVSEDEDENDDEQEAYSPRNSYAGSDAGTVFSESCPSLTGSHVSEATSFATDTSRNSIASRSNRNRYPALLIPRGSWSGYDGESKQMPFGMSPSTKVRLSPEALERLPRHVPALDTPPSLGDASSVRSESPHPNAMSSLPQTPDLHNLEVVEGQMWGGEYRLTLDTPLEIAIDEDHSIILSPQEAHSTPYSATYSSSGRSFNPRTRSTSRASNLNDLVCQFPEVPGATPIAHTPVTPSIAFFDSAGVQLPGPAFEMLQNLSKQQYAESAAGGSEQNQEEEMRECAVTDNRRRSWNDKSPVSDYSISQLSIPSPGGFFASLKTGARNTWCTPSRKTSPPPPSSTTAENFYNTPWTQPTLVKETILEYENGEEEGPPTVKQSTFDIKAREPREDSDLYGSGREASTAYEYDESYEDGIVKKAGASIDRTNNWLAAQTSYLSVLRETNPVNDLADYPPTPSLQSEEFDLKQSDEQESLKAVRFLQEAKAATTPELAPASPTREGLFLEAFNYQKSETKRSDVFLHAASRLDSVQSTRITQPKRHVRTLLNNHTSKTLEPDHARPKYRGPFSQNPRNTQDFTRIEEQDEFQKLERQQTALNAIKPSLWSLEAQRTILYNGRLMANSAASERLTSKDADAAQCELPQKSNKKRPRVLDLGGAATASWAWAAATKWPNAKVITVQTEQQAELAIQYPATQEHDVETFRPETPRNHQVMSVPCFWQLPFRDNYFDVISARTLHMYLRAHPVPENDSINEWDLTLKECMRVLKPGGVLDFFVMDSGITNDIPPKSLRDLNLSPSNMTTSNALPTPTFKPRLQDVATEFKTELIRKGYEIDGGCGRLMSRLKQEGFVGVKRQWIGLPMGCAETAPVASVASHRNTVSSSIASAWSNNCSPQRKPAFRPAHRPTSSMSLVSRIIDQYCDTDAPSAPNGSTTDVSDMSALLGELLWEEWLVRLRIASGKFTAETVLDGIDEQFGDWRRSGKAAWRGVIGWARKPGKKDRSSVATVDTSRTSVVERTATVPAHGINHGFMIETPLPTPANIPVASSHALPAICYSAPAGIARPNTPSIRRQASVRHAKMVGNISAVSGLRIDTTLRRSGTTNWSRRVNEVAMEDYTMSAVDRGEVGMIPMVIMD